MTAPGLTLLIGGARSGKSALATDIGEHHDGPVVFIATATALDQDMTARIDRHRAERPDWPTIEEPLEIGGALATAPDAALAIVDCLTLWLANVMGDGADDATIVEEATVAAKIAADRRGPTVVITNEVGSGVHPETALGRHYRDLLGIVNQRFAAAAQRTLLVVAGRVLPLRDPWEVIT